MRDSDRKEVAQEVAEAQMATAAAPAPDLQEVFDEVTSILTRRRWEVREEPFRGFESPPGKF